MQPRVPSADHNLVRSTDKSAGARAGRGPADAKGPDRRPADWKAIEEFLGLLARAVQQLHTYPLTSPMCVGAIESCHRALTALDGRDQLTVRVSPSELLIDDIPTGRGTQVGQELARRLHKASVARVTIERGASPRELGRFCEDLLRCGEKDITLTLLELTTEHGLSGVTVEMASRPEVMEVGTAAATRSDDLARERARFDAQLAKGGVVNHLYPPQKGWVRLDPASAPPSVSLLDLAVLAEDPATLASMLLRLTDDAENVPPAEALEKKYSDVAMLISALDGRVARRLFGKLARAVLDLEPGSRQALLRKTVLPGLLDGRVSGAILHDFPDVDLAESLCLLLDLETAAPELLATALSRLDLSPERRAAVVPLLDERLRARETADTSRQTTLARHARELVRVDTGDGKSFADFAAFDLSLDDDARSVLDQIRDIVPASDLVVDRLTCLWHLICLEPNPETVGGFLDRSFRLLAELERGARGAELPQWLSRYRLLAERLREPRPDVSAVVQVHLAGFCTVERATWLADLSTSRPGGREAAASVITAVGASIVVPFVEILESEADGRAPRPGQSRGRIVVQLLVEHAGELAPAVAGLLPHRSPAVLRTLLRVVGQAGAGYEDVLASHILPEDEATAREALRGLARIGSRKAAAAVVREIERQRGALSIAAEETLWHFPAAEAQRWTRELLGKLEFATSHPLAAERLLDRAVRAGAADLQPVLAGLAPMRFRIWKPALARVARKANAMLKTPVAPLVQS